MRIAFIPDTQCKPGLTYEHLRHVGMYIAEKQPEVIVHAGDHWDMPSLSSYDKGKKSFAGRRYINDIDAGKRGMEALLYPIESTSGYNPRKIFCMGNHEHRGERATELQEELEGLISPADFGLASFGWEVYPFLEPVIVSGVVFCHYLVSGVMGRPITTAGALLAKRHMPAVVGHQQGLQQATAVRADGVLMNAIIAGSCYMHKEDYLGPQANTHFRGMVMLNDVRKTGEFEAMPVSLSYLKKRYSR